MAGFKNKAPTLTFFVFHAMLYFCLFPYCRHCFGINIVVLVEGTIGLGEEEVREKEATEQEGGGVKVERTNCGRDQLVERKRNLEDVKSGMGSQGSYYWPHCHC